MSWEKQIKQAQARALAARGGSPAKLALARSKGALAWFAIVALACFALWRAVSHGPDSAARAASEQAARAVEWSLSGEKARLPEAMTSEAVERSLKERQASGLDEALAKSGAKVEAKAYALEVSKQGEQWQVKGLANAEVSSGAGAGAPWRAAWIARVEPASEGKAKVSWMRMASLPESAPFDASSLSFAVQP